MEYLCDIVPTALTHFDPFHKLPFITLLSHFSVQCKLYSRWKCLDLNPALFSEWLWSGQIMVLWNARVQLSHVIALFYWKHTRHHLEMTMNKNRPPVEGHSSHKGGSISIVTHNVSLWWCVDVYRGLCYDRVNYCESEWGLIETMQVRRGEDRGGRV